RGQVEAPGADEREVVVAPARDTRGNGRAEGGREGVGERAGERVDVDRRHQTAQRRRDLATGHRGQTGRLAVEVCGERVGPGHGRPELLDVLRSHAGEPVQPVGVVGRYAGQGRGRGATLGQQRRTRERVRPTAR